MSAPTNGQRSTKSLVDGFILCHQTEGKSPHTIEYYRGLLGRFLWYANSSGWPDDATSLTEWQVRDFLGYVINADERWGNRNVTCRTKASHATLRHYYVALKALFAWAVRSGFLSLNPMESIKVSKAKPRVIQPYTPEELRSLLKVCEMDYQQGARFLGSRNRAILLVLLDSGVRLSELTGMALSDIDTAKGRIKVRGKGDKERIVRIGKSAQKALWTYLAWRGNHEGRVWLTEERRDLRPRGVQQSVRSLKKRAGIQTKGTVHRFRHTFSLNFLKVDRNPFNLQALLGHEDLTMVKRYTAALQIEDALVAHEKASPADSMGLK